jgi:hypothetical protein
MRFSEARDGLLHVVYAPIAPAGNFPDQVVIAHEPENPLLLRCR